MADTTTVVNRTLEVFALLAGAGVVVLLPFGQIDVGVALAVLGVAVVALALASFEFNVSSS